MTLFPLKTSQAQQPTPETPPAGAPPRLVDLAAQRLNINIEYDAADLRGEVTLRLGGGASP